MTPGAMATPNGQRRSVGFTVGPDHSNDSSRYIDLDGILDTDDREVVRLPSSLEVQKLKQSLQGANIPANREDNPPPASANGSPKSPATPATPATLRGNESVSELKKRLAAANSYEEFMLISERLDCVLGNDKWKQKDESTLYDSALIRRRLEQLREAREANDVEKVLFLVRTSLQRNLGNMGDARLYQQSHTGTKKLIEDYISECEESLKTLMDSPLIDDSRLLSTMIQTRKAFGRTALVLSGGSTFGLLHIGVLYELLKAKLLPRVISGSSAGSIFASLLSIHLDDELDDLLLLLQHNFDIFEKNGEEESTMLRISRFLKYGTWFDNKYLSNTMKTLLGDLTFQEAYYRTRRILNVTVSPSSVHEMPKLLNYLTAPDVLIWSAVCASCSVPLVFASYDILAKRPGTGEHYSWSPSTFIDGSVDNDLPLARLSEMFNVNHFIACQVNPHVAPFLQMSEALTGRYENPVVAKWTDLWSYASDMIGEEVSHFLLIMSEAGILKNTSTKVRSVLLQQYSGDITILPETRFSEVRQLFKNPTPEFFEATRTRAARATWPKIAIIRNHCAIELALDKAILDMRTRLIPPRHSTSTDRFGPASRSKSYHFRRRSELLSQKSLLRKHSWHDVGSKKYWTPSPPFVSAHSSHVNLHSLSSPQRDVER